MYSGKFLFLCRGVRFPELSAAQTNSFQLNILKTILQLEATYFELAEEEENNVLVVCDRGSMDPAACKPIMIRMVGELTESSLTPLLLETRSKPRPLGQRPRPLLTYCAGRAFYEYTPVSFCIVVLSDEAWAKMVESCGYDLVELRDTRYHQVVHMTTAADGAEEFYQLRNNPVRTEGLELAREMDKKAALVSIEGGPGRELWSSC